MRFRNLVLLFLAVSLVLGLAACETATKKQSFTLPILKYLPPPAPPPPAPEPQVQIAVQQPPAPPQTDPVDKLVAESESAYQAGVSAYLAGHLERARKEFDRAVDLLLAAPPDLRSDARLEKQFEKLVDSIHNYELVALKDGDGFTERRAVPAAVDEIADLTFPTDPKLKEKVEREVKDTTFDLPLVINDRVLGYINYFSNSNRGRASMAASMQRAGRYKEMIQRVFREVGVPQDLIHLAQAESAFHPWALSRAGARGMWQFMAARGREYGLNINWWVDERQDPEKATRAAARHLKDLYQEFGDWYLAMAAYNSGPGTVHRAVERTGYVDFWELLGRNALPRETRNYVPIILAATIVAKNPEKYGLELQLPDPPVAVDAVAVSTPTDLRLIAETLDCSVALLQGLNPSLLRMVTPKGDFELNLPAGTKQRFLEQIAVIPEDKRVFWRWHKVGQGESLGEIARQYKTTAAAIAEVNGLETDQPLLAEAKLVIPVTTAREGYSNGLNGRTARLRYRVRRGDTVARVADRFGVSPSQVRTWNRVSGNRLVPGRVLVIQAPVSDLAGPGPRARSSKRALAKPAAAKSSKNKKLAAGHGRLTTPSSQGNATVTRAAVR